MYNQNGVNIGMIPDALENQVHYMHTNVDPDKPLNFEGMSKRRLKRLGRFARRYSVAFLGKNSVSDMKRIINKSIKSKVEIGFVGKIGDNKEIRLFELPIDKGNTKRSVDLKRQVNDRYKPDEQINLFLEGHTHIAAFLDNSKFGNGSNFEQHLGMGIPTKPEDYQQFLFRENQGRRNIGPTPSLLLTPYGITLYGTSRETPDGSPSPNNSYLLIELTNE